MRKHTEKDDGRKKRRVLKHAEKRNRSKEGRIAKDEKKRRKMKVESVSPESISDTDLYIAYVSSLFFVDCLDQTRVGGPT